MNVDELYSSIKLKSSNSAQIHVHQWIPENCVGVIQVSHGLAEHGKRYSVLAAEFAKQGWAVIANDHQGHGLSMSANDSLGHVDHKDIWNLLIEDLGLVNKHIRESHPNKPLLLFGHSMGAILSLSAVQRGLKCEGLVLSALAPDQPALVGFGKGLASLQKSIFGAQKSANLLVFASFGVYNMQFKPNRTKFDWLSRNNAEVDKYVNDPMCGNPPSVGYFKALFDGLTSLYERKNLFAIDSKLPVLMYAGAEDPVVGKEKEFFKTLETMRLHLPAIEWKIYPDGRHEMHNEKNREEVLNDLSSWIKDHFSA